MADSISYTQTTIVSEYDIPDKYYQEIFQKTFRSNTPILMEIISIQTACIVPLYSPYTDAQIVIKNGNDYHHILINDTSALSITPEFLEQLQVVEVSLGNEIK